MPDTRLKSKSQLHFYTFCNKHAEYIELKDTVSSNHKNMLQLGINLTKDMQDLSPESYKILRKSKNDLEIHYIHRLKD